MGIQNNMEAVSFVERNESKQETFASQMMNIKIGVIPLPLYLVLATIIYGASIYQKLPADMIGGFAVIMIMGIFLGDIGMRIPILRNIGGPAILSLFIPSLLVFFNWMNPASMEAATMLMKKSNFFILIYFLFSSRKYFRNESKSVSARIYSNVYSFSGGNDSICSSRTISWFIIWI